MTLTDFAYLDIGNTRVKLLLDGKVSYFDYNSTKWINDLLFELNEKNVRNIIFSTSNPQKSELLQKEQSSFQLINANQLLESFNDLDLNIDGMGTDRKLGLIKAYDSFDLPLITIDTGTAITINFLDQSKKCRGGFILPGIETQLISLNTQTSSLPKIAPNSSQLKIGNNTQEAILNGVIYGISGSIKNLIEKSIKELAFDKPSIVLTGGASELIHHSLKDWNYSITLQNDLVLKGLKVLHTRTMK